MGNADGSLDYLVESRYSLAQLLLGLGIVVWGVLRLGPIVWIAGLLIGAGGLAKLLARHVGVSNRTFTALNVGPVLLLAGYFAVVAAVAGSWGFAIVAVTVGGMVTAVLLSDRDAALPEGIGVVGFGAVAVYFAAAGDLLVAAVGVLFVALNGKGLLEGGRTETS